MDVAPIANWNKNGELPEVELYSVKTYWIAFKSIRTDRSGVKTETQYVIPAQYVNKPLLLDDEGYFQDDDHFVNEDGEPMEAIGWFSQMEHADFDGYYDAITFNDDRILLGWAEYLKPEFN